MAVGLCLRPRQLDGSGALDTKAAVDIARSRSSRNGTPKRRGWDVGTSRSSDYQSDGYSTYSYKIAVPRPRSVHR